MQRVVRLILSFAAAFAVIGVLAIVAINAWFERPKFSQVVAFRVERADEQLLEQLRAQEEGQTGEEEPVETDWPVQPHAGFVQLQFDVLPDGRAANIKVVGATPAGYYEEQARAEIARRRFVPVRKGGVAVPATRTEIVDFSFTPGDKP